MIGTDNSNSIGTDSDMLIGTDKYIFYDNIFKPAVLGGGYFHFVTIAPS